MALLAGAAVATEAGVEQVTHAKQDRSWTRWHQFLEEVERDDSYLDGLEGPHKIRLLGAFMESVRRGDYSRTSKKQVQAATAAAAAEDVAEVIADADWPNPLLQSHGKKH